MSSRTPNLGLPLRPVGHVQVTKAVGTMAPIVDSFAFTGQLTADDIGKTLGIVDDGDGNPVIGFIDAGSEV